MDHGNHADTHTPVSLKFMHRRGFLTKLRQGDSNVTTDQATPAADTPMPPQSLEKCVSPIRDVLWALRSKPNLHAKLDSTHLLRQREDYDDCDADVEIRLKSKQSGHRFKELRESALPGQVCY